MKLDYTLTSSAERVALVEKILEENPEPNEKYLEILADYMIYCLTKEEKKNKIILTDNRKTTIDKRETSYEGLVAQLENGEDGIYNMTDEGNRGAIFKPKITITKKDIETIPALKSIRDAITLLQEKLRTAQGKDIFILKKAIIELRKDQYLARDSYYVPTQLNSYTHSKSYIPLEDTTHEFDQNGFPIPEGISLLNPKVVSAILCNYSELQTKSVGKFEEDTWYLLQDFDRLYKKALRQYPEYQIICECKIMNMQNTEIQNALREELGVTHTVEYISSLWRKKIPKLIASCAEDEYLSYYYLNIAPGKYKKCSKCGQIKLAHNKYFSRNTTSKDGFYSICKQCRKK